MSRGSGQRSLDEPLALVEELSRLWLQSSVQCQGLSGKVGGN